LRGARTEIIVGLFALLVLVILSLMTFRVGDFTFGEKKGYKIYAFFDNIAGLSEKTKVKIAGVDAGTVEKIELFAGKARVTLWMFEDVVLYANAYATIKSTGILGDKYLEISSGSTPPVLKNGNTIRDVREETQISDLVKNIADLSSKVAELVTEVSTPEVRKSLRETLLNLRDITGDIKTTVARNKDKISAIMANLEVLTGSMKLDGPETMENLRVASANLRELLEETRPQMVSIANKTEGVIGSFEEITAKINRGEGTIGRLVNDGSLYNSISGAASGIGNFVSRVEKFKTFITFKGDYLAEDSETKGYFNLTLQPRKERYYILGVVTDPVGSVDTTTTTINGTTVTTEEVEEDKLEFNAQIAQRFHDAAVRIGLTESTFGIGADYFLINDKLKFSMDAWDFGEDEAGADSPHVRLGADLFVFKALFLSAGVDNVLNDERRTYFVGGGVTFEDEDLKYVLGAVPSIPGQ
jgi:phospholipid/cholesterol/gamma-HCH transport system substrate-binding protein